MIKKIKRLYINNYVDFSKIQKRCKYCVFTSLERELSSTEKKSIYQYMEHKGVNTDFNNFCYILCIYIYHMLSKLPIEDLINDKELNSCLEGNEKILKICKKDFNQMEIE